MAGCLMGGNTKNCNAKKTGGSNWLYLADKSNVASITVGVDNEITGITMVVGEVFYKFEFAANKSQFLEALNNEGGPQVTQTYNMIWESWDQDQRNLLMDMINCNCGMVAIHSENTGKQWFWGYEETEEAYLFTGDRDSGTAKSDINQVAPVLQALATEYAREWTLGEVGIPV